MNTPQATVSIIPTGGPRVARNGDQAEDVGRHSSGEHRDGRTHGARGRSLARSGGGEARRGRGYTAAGTRCPGRTARAAG